jgi:hypothetical protein
MTDHTTRRRPFAPLALAATLICGAGAASALPVTVTLDFGTVGGFVASPYIEDGFEVSGARIGLSTNNGNPMSSILLSIVAPSLTLTRTGGGAFSLISFDYACSASNGCDFSVGTTAITSGSTGTTDFATASPVGYSNITSLVFTYNSSSHHIDNIVLS